VALEDQAITFMKTNSNSSLEKAVWASRVIHPPTRSRTNQFFLWNSSQTITFHADQTAVGWIFLYQPGQHAVRWSGWSDPRVVAGTSNAHLRPAKVRARGEPNRKSPRPRPPPPPAAPGGERRKTNFTATRQMKTIPSCTPPCALFRALTAPGAGAAPGAHGRPGRPGTSLRSAPAAFTNNSNCRTRRLAPAGRPFPPPSRKPKRWMPAGPAWISRARMSSQVLDVLCEAGERHHSCVPTPAQTAKTSS